jgi:poly(A) polymerase
LKPTYYQSSEFGFDRKRISRAALEVVEELQRAGYDGYLVGGCVRDLMLGKRPKDFDVTTDANPEEVRGLFRRARIIGRRFRLVHVRFGREVIEVATYRAHPNLKKSSNKKRGWLPWRAKTASENGRILDDNVYGTIEDDAIRRDFTANALYYDPASEQVLDFLGGVEDINSNRIRMIGEPRERFAEDPVRMLRVLRFKAKLGLEPDKKLAAAIKEHRALIAEVPSARLYEEVLKLFHHAHGVESWHELRDSGLASWLFSQTIEVIEEEGGERWEQFILQALANTDRRISQNKPVIPAFLFAVLLWRPFNSHYQAMARDKRGYNEIVWQAGDKVFALQSSEVAVPRRVSAPAIEVWLMQGNLERRRPRTIISLLENRRFRAAYDFLLLRGKVEDIDPALIEWWTRIQDVDEQARQEMIGNLQSGDGRSKRPRKRRKSRRSRPATGSVTDPGGN